MSADETRQSDEQVTRVHQDVGYVHTVTKPYGPCAPTCPHPDHQQTSEPEHHDEQGTVAEDYGPGCECKVLCSMGPTCPGAILAGLPESGCDRYSHIRPGGDSDA